MENLTKELHPAEVKRFCVCIPTSKRHLFPAVGQRVKITDEQTGSAHDVVVGSQCRLAMRNWYDQHRDVRPGDVITFRHDNGSLSVSWTRGSSGGVTRAAGQPGTTPLNIRKQVIDRAMEVLSGAEDDSHPARIRLSENSLNIEWGDSIEQTEIIISGVQGNASKK